MSWLDTLQPASFRGVPFQVDVIDVQAGDNIVLREYPFQDLPTVFRMGEGAEEIKLSAYVIGPDYDQQREALRAVLTGEGELVHPTAGTIRCFVNGRYTIRENPTAEGGVARFDVSFVRAEPRRYPVAGTSTPQAAAAQADVAKQAAQDAFSAQWLLAQTPGWVAERAVARVRASIDSASAGLGAAAAGLGDFTGEQTANLQSLTAGLNDLVRTPPALAVLVATLFTVPQELTQAQAQVFQRAFAGLFNLSQSLPVTDFEVSVVPPIGTGLVMYGTGNAGVLGVDSASRAQLGRLASASDQLFESLAVAAWVQVTAQLELGNYDEALALRATVAAQVTRLLMRASAAEPAQALPASSWYDAMLGLLTAALADLQDRSRDLVRLTSYTPQGWEPVWLISYKLFGTVEYADEILAMNPHVTHPLLVPPGVALRIVRHE